ARHTQPYRVAPLPPGGRPPRHALMITQHRWAARTRELRSPSTAAARTPQSSSFTASAVPPERRRTPDGAQSVSLRPAPLPDDGILARNKTSFRWPAASVNVPPRLPNLGRMNTLAPWAQQLARELLQEPLARRWVHVQ